MRIYTKTGDDGTTGLFGGDRVPKDHLRIEAYGTVDELNSTIGFALANLKYDAIVAILERLQIDLFVLGSGLATPAAAQAKYSIPQLDTSDISRLEYWIDENDAQLPPLRKFILPGGSAAAASLHVARTIARRAERLLVHLSKEDAIGTHDIVFLNRLSDLLFVLARRANQLSGIPDVEWDGKKG